jgi:hypothetical protein
MARGKELVDQYWKPPVAPPMALTLLFLLKDAAGSLEDWTWLMDFIAKLPADLADLKEVRELDAFASSNADKPLDAISKLEALIDRWGPTTERLGLLGGRYKRLFVKAATPEEKLIYLDNAIEAYERGMDCDLNDYYNASNLPRLYRQRKRKGDEAKAQSVSQLVIAACERARRRGVADEWLLPTLLAAAFEGGDYDKAEELAADVAAEGVNRWKIDLVLEDLRASVTQIEDTTRRDQLEKVLEYLVRAKDI